MRVPFDPRQHPRNLVGRFRDVLGRLARGDRAELPDGVRVLRTRGGYEVSAPAGLSRLRFQRVQTVHVPEAAQAAATALDASARSTRPGSVGGARSFPSADAAVAVTANLPSVTTAARRERVAGARRREAEVALARGEPGAEARLRAEREREGVAQLTLGAALDQLVASPGRDVTPASDYEEPDLSDPRSGREILLAAREAYLGERWDEAERLALTAAVRLGAERQDTASRSLGGGDRPPGGRSGAVRARRESGLPEHQRVPYSVERALREFKSDYEVQAERLRRARARPYKPSEAPGRLGLSRYDRQPVTSGDSEWNGTVYWMVRAPLPAKAAQEPTDAIGPGVDQQVAKWGDLIAGSPPVGFTDPVFDEMTRGHLRVVLGQPDSANLAINPDYVAHVERVMGRGEWRHDGSRNHPFLYVSPDGELLGVVMGIDLNRHSYGEGLRREAGAAGRPPPTPEQRDPIGTSIDRTLRRAGAVHSRENYGDIVGYSVPGYEESLMRVATDAEIADAAAATVGALGERIRAAGERVRAMRSRARAAAANGGDLEGLTRDQLRGLLHAHGQPVNGPKPQLVARANEAGLGTPEEVAKARIGGGEYAARSPGREVPATAPGPSGFRYPVPAPDTAERRRLARREAGLPAEVTAGSREGGLAYRRRPDGSLVRIAPSPAAMSPGRIDFPTPPRTPQNPHGRLRLGPRPRTPEAARRVLSNPYVSPADLRHTLDERALAGALERARREGDAPLASKLGAASAMHPWTASVSASRPLHDDYGDRDAVLWAGRVYGGALGAGSPGRDEGPGGRAFFNRFRARSASTQKTPWTAITRRGTMVRHQHFATEAEARAAVGLEGGSTGIGWPEAASPGRGSGARVLRLLPDGRYEVRRDGQLVGTIERRPGARISQTAAELERARDPEAQGRRDEARAMAADAVAARGAESPGRDMSDAEHRRRIRASLGEDGLAEAQRLQAERGIPAPQAEAVALLGRRRFEVGADGDVRFMKQGRYYTVGRDGRVSYSLNAPSLGRDRLDRTGGTSPADLRREVGARRDRSRRADREARQRELAARYAPLPMPEGGEERRRWRVVRALVGVGITDEGLLARARAGALTDADRAVIERAQARFRGDPEDAPAAAGSASRLLDDLLGGEAQARVAPRL